MFSSIYTHMHFHVMHVNEHIKIQWCTLQFKTQSLLLFSTMTTFTKIIFGKINFVPVKRRFKHNDDVTSSLAAQLQNGTWKNYEMLILVYNIHLLYFLIDHVHLFLIINRLSVFFQLHITMFSQWDETP